MAKVMNCLAKHPDYWEIGVEGERFQLNVVDPRKKSLRIASGEGKVYW